jgi:hypothetical protein
MSSEFNRATRLRLQWRRLAVAALSWWLRSSHRCCGDPKRAFAVVSELKQERKAVSQAGSVFASRPSAGWPCVSVCAFNVELMSVGVHRAALEGRRNMSAVDRPRRGLCR